jgi:hypothetical protein
MHSPTFAAAYNKQLNAVNGVVLNPVSFSGGGQFEGNNIIFGTLSGEHDDGSIQYPAYVIAHEFGHADQTFPGANKAWNLSVNDPNVRSILDAARAPNTAEYYAWNFAEQVSREVLKETGVNIGSDPSYFKTGQPILNIGLYPKK